MDEPPAPEVPEAADARDLARAQDKVEAARAVLARLLQDVVVAESRMSDGQAARLLEADEQLAFRSLRNLMETETVAQAMAEHKRRHAELREANERLVLAALSAKELQAAAERAQRRQAEFMNLVAHELDNPLAPIRLATAMLGRVRTDEPLLPRAQSIIELQVQNMTRLVAAVHDVSRANSAAANLDRQVVDVAALATAAAATYRIALDARRQTLAVQVPPGAVNVLGDPARLEQIVRNLLDNASKYTPDRGAIQLSVEVQGEGAVITVSDDGIGISAQALPSIFEPFVHDIHAIGFNGVGVGIGLTVVRALVEAHGGSVVAVSAGTDRGSRFIVTLRESAAVGVSH
jgi:signal transduction histidine kinase